MSIAELYQLCNQISKTMLVPIAEAGKEGFLRNSKIQLWNLLVVIAFFLHFLKNMQPSILGCLSKLLIKNL